jgi:pyruvate/2-oxoglutarate dehydrogenase complex dihydrolipoamide acyltransferase (E2) component
VSTPIRVPRVGQSMTEATLVSWERTTGDRVEPGDVVATIETDKTEVEVEAPAAGVLGALRALEGDIYAVGTLLAYVLADGEAEPVADDASPAAAFDAPAATPSTIVPATERRAVSPRARRLAEERGIDLATVAGTGPDGLITEQDVAAAGDAAPSPAVTGRRRPLTARERTAVRHLTTSWQQAPHFTQMVDAEMHVAQARRARHPGVTITDVVLQAVVHALRVVPQCNVCLDADHLVEPDAIDVGLAVDAPGGLVVPVLHALDTLDLPTLAARAHDAARRARAHELTPDDVGPAAATVSNLGALGIRAGTAVLPVDHAVLVFVGAIEDRAVVRDGTVVVREMCTLSLTYDHRVIDGATGARFARALVAQLEQEDPP